jgi:hypothetical protein
VSIALRRFARSRSFGWSTAASDSWHPVFLFAALRRRTVVRMFGIRTLLLGCDLLILRGPNLERAVKMAVVIHASDTASAVVGGIRHEVPRKTAVLTTAISAINTALALVAMFGRAWEEEGRPHGAPFAPRFHSSHRQ